jgi:ribulose-phosphate 3-epimerase
MSVRRPVVIAPSLLASDHGRLAEGAARAEASGGDWLHVDIMDGLFVPNLTFGPAVVASVRKAVGIPLDVHLMLLRPDRYVEPFLRAGASVLSVHVEAEHEVADTLARIRAAGAQAGLALNPDTPLERAIPHLGAIDLLLCMTVFPGFGGQAFMPAVLDKTREAAKYRDTRGLEFRIEVDGGVSMANAADCAAAGVDTLVAGTSLYGLEDMAAGVRAMREAAEAARA